MGSTKPGRGRDRGGRATTTWNRRPSEGERREPVDVRRRRPPVEEHQRLRVGEDRPPPGRRSSRGRAARPRGPGAAEGPKWIRRSMGVLPLRSAAPGIVSSAGVRPRITTLSTPPVSYSTSSPADFPISAEPSGDVGEITSRPALLLDVAEQVGLGHVVVVTLVADGDDGPEPTRRPRRRLRRSGHSRGSPPASGSEPPCGPAGPWPCGSRRSPRGHPAHALLADGLRGDSDADRVGQVRARPRCAERGAEEPARLRHGWPRLSPGPSGVARALPEAAEHPGGRAHERPHLP